MNAMNIQNLPYDIHNLIFDNLENGKDMYNFKNTCKTFNNYVNNEIPLNSLIFKMKYKLIFNNCDINKHSLICKKMSSILEKFNLYEIHFNRTHNSCKSIFDTQTVIYVSMFTDNVKEHKDKFKTLIENHNLTNYHIILDIIIYFTEGFIENIINNYTKNNNDIIINNESLQKITETDMCIHEYENVINKYYYNYRLDNDKLFINKSELIYFLIKKIKKQEKEIEKGIVLMDNSQDEEFIINTMTKLDDIVANIIKFKKLLERLEKNINNCMKDKVKKRLEATFMMID
tara:strand:+ start:53 stop:916 length:864 start_codon:yes stop_codon:yes gene_type:complete